MHMCVHGFLDYTITYAYVRAWFSRVYYNKCIHRMHGSLDYSYQKCICACIVLWIILSQMHMCVRGSLDYTITTHMCVAWFSRLYYNKCICACIVL